MIKNDKQYTITKGKRNQFLESLELLKTSDDNSLFNQIMIDSVGSQIETLNMELAEYEKLKNERPKVISSRIENLPELLIKARIARNLSQKELAIKIGLKEQQIQRYEACNYQSASFEKLLLVASSMELDFEPTRATFRQEMITINGYEPNFLLEATQKLRQNRRLLVG